MTVTVTLTARDDAEVEGLETATFSIVPDAAYEAVNPTSATLRIADNDGTASAPAPASASGRGIGSGRTALRFGAASRRTPLFSDDLIGEDKDHRP
jgi:hypothetical protein